MTDDPYAGALEYLSALDRTQIRIRQMMDRQARALIRADCPTRRVADALGMTPEAVRSRYIRQRRDRP